MASETTGVSGVAERYAAALFDLADERRTLDDVASDLRQLRAMLMASADLSRLVRSPILTREITGPEPLLWASDYPHPEYHPGILDELRARIEPLEIASRDRILGRNAVDAYALPL